MHQAQWSPERPLPPPVSLASQSHHEKPPEVPCTSRGTPGFPASTRESPRETFFNTSRGQIPLGGQLQDCLSISHLWASDLPSSTPRDPCWLSPLGWRLRQCPSVSPHHNWRFAYPTNAPGLPTMLRKPGVRRGGVRGHLSAAASVTAPGGEMSQDYRRPLPRRRR